MASNSLLKNSSKAKLKKLIRRQISSEVICLGLSMAELLQQMEAESHLYCEARKLSNNWTVLMQRLKCAIEQ
jgi:hypothetical protein